MLVSCITRRYVYKCARVCIYKIKLSLNPTLVLNSSINKWQGVCVIPDVELFVKSATFDIRWECVLVGVPVCCRFVFVRTL